MFTGDTINITVIAKDSSGKFVTTGGDIFTVKISNLCNKYNDYYCKPSGATSPLSANVNDVMVDHNNGTYTYSYTLSAIGSISVQVYLMTPGKVYQEYYNTPGWTRTSTSNCIANILNFGSSIPSGCGSYSINFSSYIIGAIIAPETRTYNFSIYNDDGCTIYIDDIQKYYIACGGIHTEYFSTNLINSKYYTFFVKFCQGVAGYQFTLSWNYPSLSSFSQIPMNNIFLPSLVSNSPYTINSAATVCGDGKRTGVETCDDANVNSGDGCSSTCTVESGYICTGGSSTTKDVCSEMCGDGVRFNLISTYCDDKNTINGDGCSSTCTVESGFTCTGGSSTTKDTCTEICGDGVKFNTISTYCDDKNLVNKDGCSSSCTVETGFTCSGGSSSSKDICSTIFVVTAQEAAAAKSTQAAIGAGASMNIGVSLLNTSSPLGFFSMLNQFQLLYILLVSGAYISDGVFNLITGMSFALFNFNFINIKEINAFNFIYLCLSFEQTNVNLNKIGLVSGSTFITLLNLMLMIAILGLFHAIFIPVYFKCKKLGQRSICARIGNRLYVILTFNIYVRIAIQANIIVLLSCFGEIYEFQVKTSAEIISYSINLLICVLIFTFYGLCIWQVKKAHPQLNPINQFYFIELFAGLKNKTTSRIYSLVFCGQRIISCLLVILLGSLSLTIKIAILSVIQFLSLLYLLIIRPYEKVKDMISECMSQCIMTFFCCILTYFNTKDQWNSVINWIFIGTLMTSTVIATLIAFIDLFIIIVKKIKNSCCNNNKVQQFRTNRHTVVSNIGQDFGSAIPRKHEAQMKLGEENKTIRSGKSNFKHENSIYRIYNKLLYIKKICKI